MDKFTRAYLECALWVETDNSNPQGGEPLDENYCLEDIEPESLKVIEEECRQFQLDNSALMEGLDPVDCGHDFWLTRNGHGAGFWDRGIENGDKLTDACKPWGEAHLMVGDDGRLYYY